MLKIIKLNSKVNLKLSKKLVNLRCLNTMINKRSSLLNRQFVCLNKDQKRSDANKEMKEVEEFLKSTKNPFLDLNQTETEDEITRKELFLFYGSAIFAISTAIAYLVLYKVERPQTIDYEKYKWNPNEEVKKLDTTPKTLTVAQEIIKEV